MADSIGVRFADVAAHKQMFLDVLCFASMRRKSFPPAVETEVFVKSRRRCAICFCIDSDADWKEGQLAHIDKNRENNAPENAAFLCTVHHPRYDSISRQTKGFKPGELKQYLRILYAYVESLEKKPHKKRSIGKRPSHPRGTVSLEVYDRRIPMYRMTLQFVRDVVEDLRPELKRILQFGADTDEAMFLFDETVAEYLGDLFKRALRLHTIDLLRKRAEIHNDLEGEEFQALVREETDLALWFSEQHREIQSGFAPFLRLA